MNSFNLFVGFMIIGFIALLINISFVMKPFYLWINHHIKSDFYDETKHPLDDWDCIGKGWYAALNVFIQGIPFIIIGFILPAIFIYWKIIYGIVVAIGIFIPILVFELRDDVFTHPVKKQEEDGYIYIYHFIPGKYSFNYSVMYSGFIMFCATMFGLANYITEGHIRFLVLTLLCVVFELMIIFIDKVDKVLPVDLTDGHTFGVYGASLTVLSFVLSLIFYSWTSWV